MQSSNIIECLIEGMVVFKLGSLLWYSFENNSVFTKNFKICFAFSVQGDPWGESG